MGRDFYPSSSDIFKRKQIDRKKVALFACCSGGSAEKCFLQLEKEISDCPVLLTLRLIDPVKNANQEDTERIYNFCAKLKMELEK